MDSSKNEPIQGRSWIRRYGYSVIMLAVCIAMGAYILMRDGKADELPVQGPGTEFSYTDIEGNEVALSNTNGKARLLYFFFANCPDVCPPTTFVMSQVQDELKEDGVFGDEVQFLSVSIDPTRDTPEVLKEYSERFEADPNGWKFLRGDEQETAALARKYQILVEKDKEGNFSHMNLIVLMDKNGQIRDWISANDYIETGDGGEKLTPSDMAKLIKSVL
ncbi:SCO family protein [Cohnella sp.]|uniref:SCO family protein n=1 Tax=Cohnella sp. TaxID=1883426 RepID=UPI003563B95A